MLNFFAFLCAFSSALRAGEAKWEILGINEKKKLIAYKYVYLEEDGEGNSAIDCLHPDVPPGQGVQLGLWSVQEAKTIKSWDIYKSLLEYNVENNKESCMTAKEAKEQLALAKKSYSQLDIDITSKPSGIRPTKKGFFLIVDKNGKEHLFSIVEFADLPIPGDEATGQYLLKRWIRNSKSQVVYSLELEGTKMMASSLDVQFPTAYLFGDPVVFLQQVTSFSMRHTDTTYRFTPPIDIQ